MMMVHGQAARHEDTWRRSDDDGTGRQPDMRIPGGDQMMMVHGQAARHEDTWRRSDDDGTRAGSQTRGYLEEIR